MTTIYLDEEINFLPVLRNGVIATVGFFDGVHQGHRFLIEQLKKQAERLKLPSVVITFPTHPRKILQSDYKPDLLNSFEERLFQLSTTGIDYCYVLDFTEELSEMSARDFIRQKLNNELGIKALLIGYDHKFGKGRVDGFEQYKAYGNACGMEIIKADPFQEKDLHISSTTVRQLLSEGKVKKAAEVLTYNYTLEGNVINGNKLGREMGFPTANIELSEKDKVIPEKGIYATWVYFDNKRYMGMSYIGNRPTIFYKGEPRIEVNILNFSGNLYGKTIKLEFVDYIRGDEKFEYVEDLRKQLFSDKKMTENILGETVLG